MQLTNQTVTLAHMLIDDSGWNIGSVNSHELYLQKSIPGERIFAFGSEEVDVVFELEFEDVVLVNGIPR